MAIVFACPVCGKRYEVDEKWAGKRARCKKCAKEMQIPEEEIPEEMPVLVERPAKVNTGARFGPTDDSDEGPRPGRAGQPRKSGSKRKLSAELPPLVKAGLLLIAVLVGGSGIYMVGMAVATGRSELAVLPLAMLGAFACAGLAAVSYLKLLFLANAESRIVGFLFLALFLKPFFLPHGQSRLIDGLFVLPGPLYMLYFVARRWEETKGLAAAWAAGLAGLILWFVFVPPYLRPSPRPPGPMVAGIPGLRLPQPDPEQTIRLIVTEMPSGDAREVIQEKIGALHDPGGGGFMGEASPEGQTVFNVWPVSDPEACARRITFGRVTSVSGREITVAADPVAADEIENYRALKEAKKTVADRPKPALRPEAKPEPELPADPDPVTRSLAALRSSDEGKRKRAVGELARTAPIDERRDEVQRALRPLLGDEDGFLVNDVIKALAAWHTPETVPTLIPMTTDRRFGVRWQALETLGRLGDPRAAEAIAGRLKEDGIKAEPALRELGPAAEPALIALLRSPDPDTRRKACDILRETGGDDTLAFMRGVRPDPDFGVRMAAQEAMKAILARVGPQESASPTAKPAPSRRSSRPGR